MRKYYRNTKGQFSKKPNTSGTTISSGKYNYRNSKGQFSKRPITKISKPVKKSTRISKPVKKSTKISKPIKKSTKISKPVKKSTKISKPVKKSITSTSKSTQSELKTSNKNIKNFTRNFTFEFKPKIDTAIFELKINYLIRKILANYRDFKFNTLTICNVKSLSIFSNNKRNYEIGHNSKNQICKDLLEFEQLLRDFFNLIKQTSIDSRLYIEFIDLTISIYKF